MGRPCFIYINYVEANIISKYLETGLSFTFLIPRSINTGGSRGPILFNTQILLVDTIAWKKWSIIPIIDMLVPLIIIIHGLLNVIDGMSRVIFNLEIPCTITMMESGI